MDSSACSNKIFSFFFSDWMIHKLNSFQEVTCRKFLQVFVQIDRHVWQSKVSLNRDVDSLEWINSLSLNPYISFLHCPWRTKNHIQLFHFFFFFNTTCGNNMQNTTQRKGQDVLPHNISFTCLKIAAKLTQKHRLKLAIRPCSDSYFRKV